MVVHEKSKCLNQYFIQSMRQQYIGESLISNVSLVHNRRNVFYLFLIQEELTWMQHF